MIDVASAELADRYRAAGVWRDRTIGDELTAIAQRHPSVDAVVDRDRRIDFAELDRRTDALAAGLLSIGLRPGDRVTLGLGNRCETVEAWYGMIKAGIVPVCTLPVHGRRELTAIAELTAARAHFVDADVRDGSLLELARAVRAEVTSMRLTLTVSGAAGDGDHDLAALIESGWADGAAVVAETRRGIDPYGLAVLQLSGGTTATPKAIPRSHSEYWYNGAATARRFGIKTATRVAHVLPIVHNAGVHSALHAAHAVGAAVLLAPADPDAFVPFLLAAEVDDLVLIPGMASALLARADARALFARLRRLSLTAAPVPAELFERFSELGVPVVQQFGMGEGFCTGTPIDAPPEMRRETVGYPLSDLDRMRVVDERGNDVPAGTFGELWVRGPYTIGGYWEAPERNAQAFTDDGFYKTGDVVAIRSISGHRCLKLGGRIKDLINRGGEKVNAEEVELLLLEHPAIEAAAVVAMPDRRLGERACAFVVTVGGRSLALAEVTDYLADLGVAKFKWPERLELISSLPTTAVGKLSKAQLRENIARQLAKERSSADEDR